MDLQEFSGDIVKWKEFWDTFDATVHKSHKLSPVEKFAYLKGKLCGEALNCISGLSLSNGNYDVAVKLLLERYGDNQAVINAHYIKLMELPMSTNQIGKLRTLHDDIETHLRSLQALGQDIDQHVFVSMITSKLPQEVLIHLELQKGHANSWTVTNLRGCLKNYILARESAERLISQTKYNQKTKEGAKFASSASSYRTPNAPLHSTAEALVTGERQEPPTSVQSGCRFCGKFHWSDECQTYPTLDSRKEKIKGNCFNCLKRGHKVKECKYEKPCFHCNQRKNHHRSLCPKKFSSVRTEYSHLVYDVASTSASPVTSLIASGEAVIMQTATAKVCKPNRDSFDSVRLLLDSGSQRTYITEDLATKMKLDVGKYAETVSIVTFGSAKPQIIKTPVTSLNLELKDGTHLSIKANVVPKITGVIHRIPVNLDANANWRFLCKDVQLADTVPYSRETSTLDLLIGNDYYLDLILPQKIELHKGLYLLGSRLGWIIAGRVGERTEILDEPSMLVLTFGQQLHSETHVFTPPDKSLPLKPNLDQFWNLETIGISHPPKESGDSQAVENFKKSVMSIDNRYYVTWPWKETFPDLPENYGLAYGRFKSLIYRLGKNTDLLRKYSAIINDQEQKGVIEKVTETTVEGPVKHYIPHHAVVTPTKATTKVRVVYDASAKVDKNSKSLNEALYRGPVMLCDLCGLLFRFRMFKITLLADIEKAFLQVGLQNPDRDVTRFFWLKDSATPRVDGNTQIYRFCRVPFGVISSPFLLAATISHHLQKVGTQTARQLEQNIYVDNVITGCNTVKEAEQFYHECKQIFWNASMNLRDWTTNSSELKELIPPTDQDKRTQLNVLGLPWVNTEDVLNILAPLQESFGTTKRDVLKSIASIFDPLGFFSPVTLGAKLFLQELWIEKMDWDDTLSKVKQSKWNSLCHTLQEISDVDIPRYIGIAQNKLDQRYRLLCFCDASKRAYATVIYLQVQAGECYSTNLIFSKSRLAPLKEVSLPRLELLAVLIGVRAIDFVSKELKVSIESKVIWTDSQCVLHWIKSDKPLTVFVENRLKEIRSKNDIEFRYVSTTDNPADLATRPTTVSCLPDKDWWHGPAWLTEDSDTWPTWCTYPITNDIMNSINTEVKKRVLFEAKLAAQEGPIVMKYPFGMDIEKYSSLTRLLRVSAWCLRFLKRLKKQDHSTGPLTAQELLSARNIWIQNVQERHFPDVFRDIGNKKVNNLQKQLGIQVDSSKLLRCHGRLTYADLSQNARSPVLLPKSDPLTKLVIDSYHKRLLHAGVSQTLSNVRQEFWIVHGRSAVKSALKSCHVCRRTEGGPYRAPVMPPLPKQRVVKSTPFSYTGLDYLGPLYVKNGTETTKVWVCLFTCMAVRAVHLELVLDMTTQQFILCFRRFVAKCGTPIQVTSDNAQQFKLAKSTFDVLWKRAVLNSEVKNYISNQGIQWNFITELAPWMGGFYERLIGVVKRCLRKSVGKSLLTTVQLQTLLTEVQAVVNSRPLVYVEDDINSNYTITPADFLTLNRSTGFPTVDIDSKDPDFQPSVSSAEKLLHLWKKGNRQLESFWKSWRNEYLTSLRERPQNYLKGPKTEHTASSPKIGDIVLVKDNLPRAAWKIGKIIELITSRDEHVRSATVLLPSKKTIYRAIRVLYPIECPMKTEDITEDSISVPLDKTVDVNVLPKRQAALRARKLIAQQLV